MRIIGYASVMAAGLFAAQAVSAQNGLNWRMVSTHNANLPTIGENAVLLAEEITAVTGGSIEVEFFGPGTLVPANAVFDAVSQGSVETGFHHGAFLAGRIPAAQFIGGSIPFSMEFLEHWAWYDVGGGRELHEEIYAPFNVHPMMCNATSREAGGWYRSQMETVEDFDGLRFRIAGLGGAVLDRLGASTQVTAVAEIYPALERGVLDATDVGTPALDIVTSFYEVANHYYFPGWHQPSSFNEFLVNKEIWDGLSDTQRRQIESACRGMIARTIALGEAAQGPAISAFIEKGVEVERFSDEILSAFQESWKIVVAEEAEKNEDVARVWQSMTDFHAKYKVWDEANSIEYEW